MSELAFSLIWALFSDQPIKETANLARRDEIFIISQHSSLLICSKCSKFTNSASRRTQKAHLIQHQSPTHAEGIHIFTIIKKFFSLRRIFSARLTVNCSFPAENLRAKSGIPRAILL